MTTVQLLIVMLLILLTAFFVAAEFAVVKIRKSRVDALVEQNVKGAKHVQTVITNLDGYLAACQLGITVTALGIGWLGEPAVASLLHPVLGQFDLPKTVSATLSFIIAFSLITFLHVVLGELAPKSFSIQKTEKVSFFVAPLLIIFYKIMYPFIQILNGSARLLVRLFGLSPISENDDVHSEEELRLIMATSYERGEINAAEMNYVNKIFEFDEKVAKEVMVPRTEIICLYADQSKDENFEVLNHGKYTRYPVAGEDKDDIIGFVNIKDLFNGMMRGVKEDPKSFIRPIIHVVEHTPLNELFIEMQKERSHMAIVMDEYGGTAGLVTVEDILEEVFGEIRDEFDTDETPMIQKLDEETYLVDGKVLLSDLAESIDFLIAETDIDTIGGWILFEDNDAQVGDEFTQSGFKCTVAVVENHQIKQVKIEKI